MVRPNGWKPSIIKSVVSLNHKLKAVDCGVGLLGKGYELRPVNAGKPD